jgi:hypothetical protein
MQDVQGFQPFPIELAAHEVRVGNEFPADLHGARNPVGLLAAQPDVKLCVTIAVGIQELAMETAAEADQSVPGSEVEQAYATGGRLNQPLHGGVDLCPSFGPDRCFVNH